tara:strand:- start:26521 stop:30366 length:3846 start_codon:yes stop_codon:yes gene_type:complete
VPAYILETGRSYRNPIESRDFQKVWNGYEGVPDGYQIEFYDEGPGSLPLGKDNVHYIGDEEEIKFGKDRRPIYRFYRGGEAPRGDHTYIYESRVRKEDFPGEANKGKIIKAYNPEPRRNTPIFWMLEEPGTDGAIAFYRHYRADTADTKITSNQNESNYTNTGVIGYMPIGESDATKYGDDYAPLYHYYSTRHSDNFYSHLPNTEVNLSGSPIPPSDAMGGDYVYQGVIGYVYRNAHPTTGVKASFASDGNSIIVGGTGGGELAIQLQWNDNPSTAGTAVDTVAVGGVTLTRSGRRGQETKRFQISEGTYPVTFTGLHGANSPINVVDSGKRLCLKDGHGGDCNANVTILSVDIANKKRVLDVGKIGPCGMCYDKSGWYDYGNPTASPPEAWSYFQYRQQFDANSNRTEGPPCVNGWGNPDNAEILQNEALFEWSYGLNGAVKGAVPRYLGFEDMYDSQFVYYLYDTTYPWNGPIYSIQYILSDAACCPNAFDNAGCPECIPNYTYHSHFYEIDPDRWETTSSSIEVTNGNSWGVGESFWTAGTDTPRLLFRYTSTTGSFKRGEKINGWLINEVRYFGDQQKCGFMELAEEDADNHTPVPFVFMQEYTSEDGATAVALAGYGIGDKVAFFGTYEFRKRITYYRVEINEDALVAQRTLDEAKLEAVINSNGELASVKIINAGKGYKAGNIQLSVSSPGVMEEFSGGDLASEMYNQTPSGAPTVPSYPSATKVQGYDAETQRDYDIQMHNTIEKGANTLAEEDAKTAGRVVYNRGKATTQKQAKVEIGELDELGSILSVYVIDPGMGYTKDHPPYVAVVVPDKVTRGFDGQDVDGYNPSKAGSFKNVTQYTDNEGFSIDETFKTGFDAIHEGTQVHIPEGYLKITDLEDTDKTTLCQDLPAACLQHSFPGIISDALPKDDNFKEIVKYSDAIGDYYQELWPDVVSTSKTADREVIQRGGLYGFNNGKRCIELPQPKAYTASRFFDIPCTYKGISEPLDPDVEPEPTAFGWMIHKYCASKEDNASFNVSMTLEGHTTGSQGQDFMDFLRNNMPAAKLTPTRTVPTGEKTWHCHRGPIDGRCYRDPNSSGMVFVPVGLDENTFDYNRSGYTELEQLQHWAGQNITTSSGQATWTAHADPEVPGSGTEHTFDYTQINVAAFVNGAPPNLCWDSFVRDVNAADGPLNVYCGYDIDGNPLDGQTYGDTSELFNACVALNLVLDSAIAVQPGRQTGTNKMVMGPYKGEMRVRNYLTGATQTYAKAVQYLSNPYFSECETDIGDIIGNGF